MLLHFWDSRNEETICEIDKEDFVPRVGDTVAFCYTDDGDSGMWKVVDVTWSYFIHVVDTAPYVDIGLTPYNEGCWNGTADAQLKASV